MKTRTPGKKVNKAWLHDHINDPYVKQAQRDGYRARAAYKLKEIDESFGLIKPGQVVVDLGSSPGAWSQYVRRGCRPSPRRAGGGATGRTQWRHHRAWTSCRWSPSRALFSAGRLSGGGALKGLEAALAGRQADVVVSDMAPNLSGIGSADAARVVHLVELAMEFAQAHLKPEGALVVKLFHGSGYSELVRLFRETFRGGQTVQAEGLARSVLRDLSGGGSKV
jgi:23S rRNA (uridine2552-2'-O)-methyltransferase